jgi:hypothetical protein
VKVADKSEGHGKSRISTAKEGMGIKILKQWPETHRVHLELLILNRQIFDLPLRCGELLQVSRLSASLWQMRRSIMKLTSSSEI